MVSIIIYQVRHIGALQHSAQVAPELLFQATHRKIASFLRRINIIVGVGTRQPVVAALRHKTAAKVQAGSTGHQRHCHVVQGNIYLLSLARHLCVAQRNHNAHACRHRRIHIRHQHARNRRLALRLTAHSGNACQAHVTDIMVGLLGQRSFFAVACQRAVDNSRVHSLRRRIVNAKLFQHTRAIAFHHHVGSFHQLQKRPASRIRLQVKHYALFIAVQLQMPVTEILEERRKAASIIAPSRLFDFDNLCTKIGQQHCTIRSRQQPRQIKHTNTL